ncbi:MAG: isoaspartyl peptidase/L-asparaginase, partial [Acidobacteria bacterium]|nr:isoaspartyl peptidase/L-asparaginase [Acidobacteriota bacterium]
MKPALAIHGGAGTILRSSMTAELEADYRGALTAALETGNRILSNGGSAMDAVEACVVSLEDFPLFNAGRGSVFTHDGKIEMDASIMDGSRLRAGAVAFVK